MPSFCISTGERLTVILFRGKENSSKLIDARTRSLGSSTALSGKPTTLKAEKPPIRYICMLRPLLIFLESYSSSLCMH